jgi:hypothetical protein
MVRIVFGKINRILARQVESPATESPHGEDTSILIHSADFLRGPVVTSSVGAKS